jgi:hypothetical protein
MGRVLVGSTVRFTRGLWLSPTVTITTDEIGTVTRVAIDCIRVHLAMQHDGLPDHWRNTIDVDLEDDLIVPIRSEARWTHD